MSTIAARHVRVEGVVQGVGFRPFVHGLAAQHGLAGWVRNTGAGVEAIVEGDDARIEAFLADLSALAPPLARIAGVHSAPETAAGLRGFAIVASERGVGTQPVPADVALCADCRRELADPTDRRYRYPFINCTNCGPRYSIVKALPYDRERTTMAAFAMCAACRQEYEDPRSRRFHAEPIACPACGPRLELVAGGARARETEALADARALLTAGKVVALKGLGGYHLACDARSDVAVERLRAWKMRGDKPLAVMVRDEAELDRVAVIDAAERALLISPAHPVVLLNAHAHNGLSVSVHPGTRTLGVMLPYTPLHELLIAFGEPPVPPVLVMTSANRAAEPMIVDDALALQGLQTIADAILVHDRAIATRVDDSVSHVIDGDEAPLRRARGYAPLPLRLPFAVLPLLACGGDVKNAFCLATDRQATLSPYVGDLENYDVYRDYEAAIDHLSSLLRIDPQLVCYDAHPQYWSRRFAERRYPDRPHIAVQHHHAHIAACMAEHDLAGPVIGIAFDGTGYGDDGAVWGGEVLVAGYASFERAAHFAYVPMFGGAAAIREPWRMAVAYLRAAKIPWDERFAEARTLDVQTAAPLTSSAGRLFDAVAALLDVRRVASYEAQAAIELEALAGPTLRAAYEFVVHAGSPRRIDVLPMIAAIVADLDRGTPRAVIAGRFQATLTAIVRHACTTLHAERGIDTVVLSGGVFQNRTLSHDVAFALEQAGFHVYRHHAVPANDGGIALGQAVVGAARMLAGNVE